MKVKDGAIVNLGTILCEYRPVGSSTLYKLKSPHYGTIGGIALKPGAVAQAGFVLPFHVCVVTR